MSIATGGSSAVGSLSGDTEMVFNLACEHDALALLRRIHLSALSLDLKNYLRDLVFSTRFGELLPVDVAFIATFASHGFSVKYEPGEARKPVLAVPPETSPVTISSVAVPVHTPVIKSVAGFGFQRSAPVFAAPPVTAVVTPKIKTPVVSPVAPEDVVPVPPAAPLVAPVIATPEPLPQTTPVVATHTGPVEVPPVVPKVPAPPEENIPVPASPAVAASVSAVVSVPAERIAAIKHEVNALVGNPVNLIDVNNEVGREYMNALLDAMKKSLGGTPAQEVERAMARLERSFGEVKKVLQEAETTAAAVATDTEEAAVTPDTEESDNRWSTPVVSASAATPVEEVTSYEPVTSSAPAVAEPAVQVAAVPEVVSSELPDIVLEPVTEPEPALAAVTGFAAAAAVVPVDEAGMHAVPEQVAAPEVAVLPEEPSVTSSEVITSVAKEKQLRELMEARHAAEAEASAKRAEQNAHNPLMADDVTRGLTQLLSEWKLFKSSGIFGTGPSGHEHPLYKKIAPLTMAAVLAGRFDGATPEIKRSITDYMNGWRYEEGVTHEVGESFENYLRRVIRHILDKQTAG